MKLFVEKRKSSQIIFDEHNNVTATILHYPDQVTLSTGSELYSFRYDNALFCAIQNQAGSEIAIGELLDHPVQGIRPGIYTGVNVRIMDNHYLVHLKGSGVVVRGSRKTLINLKLLNTPEPLMETSLPQEKTLLLYLFAQFLFEQVYHVTSELGEELIV